MGTIYTIRCVDSHLVHLLKTHREKLPPKRALRYRVSRWLPYAFYFFIFYVYVLDHAMQFGFDREVKECLVVVFITLCWLGYEIIAAYTRKSYHQILSKRKKHP